MTNRKHNIRKLAVAAALGFAAFGGVAATTAPAIAAEEVFITDGYALQGYDPVAYFTVGSPTPGNAQFVADYDGATYRFASAENRDLFNANPGKYAPQYGGYCAFGAAMGRKFGADPAAWRIVDNKLYLNLNKDVQKRWIADIPGFIRGADHNWDIIRGIEDAHLADESKAPKGLTIGAQ